jgi:hypothetical protein
MDGASTAAGISHLHSFNFQYFDPGTLDAAWNVGALAATSGSERG